MNKETAYDVIRRTLLDQNFMQEIMENPDNVLFQQGIRTPEEISELKNVLSVIGAGIVLSSEAGKQMMDQQEKTFETANELKSGLIDVTKQIQSGFKNVMTMYNVAFYFGVLLIALSAIFAFWKGESLLPIVFGGLGVADVIAYFITKPPQSLQDSRANLCQLQAAYYNWFLDVYNWNSFLIYLQQTGQLNLQNVKEVSETLLQNTAKMMELIDKYCESKAK